MVQLSFKLAFDSLEKQQVASADDLIPSIVYILCQAKLEFPFSIERFVEIFGDKDS